MLIPESTGALERAFFLAHEIGHLLMHSGAGAPFRAKKLEVQADRWAACALIPLSAVLRHKNACEDAFIGALSRHYEDIPMHDCDTRRLAARIARLRLQALTQEAS